jgi:hypothetical protein
MSKHTLETIVAFYAENNTRPPSTALREALAFAVDAGTSNEDLEAVANAGRLSRTPKVVLPAHRFENLSRGKGWARCGQGNDAVWGERVDGGYLVGPGRWVVGGNDGFHRKGQTAWTVSHVTVGDAVWTVAS